MRSFQSVLAGTALAATASLGVIAPLESRATPSLGEDLAYVADAELCIPQFSIDFQLPERVIVVDQRNSCPVSSQVYLHLADDKRELRLIAHQSQNFSGRWVTQVDPVAKGGLYRVMGIEYLNGQVAKPLDQRITILGSQEQEQSAPSHPLVRFPPTLRQEVSPKHPPQVSLDAESKRILTSLLDHLRQLQDILARFRDFLNTLPLG